MQQVGLVEITNGNDRGESGGMLVVKGILTEKQIS
jgi:hypothetical protein